MEFIKIIFQQLNNRESAIIIYFIFFFLIFLIFFPSVRKSFWGILKTLFSGKILFILIMNVCLFAVLIFGMEYFKLWNNIFWKDAIIWFLASFIMLFNANKALNDKNYYKKEFLKFLKWESIIIFVISLYSFSLVTELIFIPVFAFLIILQSYCSYKEENKQLKNILDILILFISLFVIYLSVKHLVINLKTYLVISNLYLFIFPIALTIFYLPFLYIFSLFMAYEEFFSSLKRFLKDNFKIKNKLRILFICGLKISNVQKFRKQVLNIDHVRSQDDLLVSIKNYANKN